MKLQCAIKGENIMYYTLTKAAFQNWHLWESVDWHQKCSREKPFNACTWRKHCIEMEENFFYLRVSIESRQIHTLLIQILLNNRICTLLNTGYLFTGSLMGFGRRKSYSSELPRQQQQKPAKGSFLVWCFLSKLEGLKENFKNIKYAETFPSHGEHLWIAYRKPFESWRYWVRSTYVNNKSGIGIFPQNRFRYRPPLYSGAVFYSTASKWKQITKKQFKIYFI